MMCHILLGNGLYVPPLPDWLGARAWRQPFACQVGKEEFSGQMSEIFILFRCKHHQTFWTPGCLKIFQWKNKLRCYPQQLNSSSVSFHFFAARPGKLRQEDISICASDLPELDLKICTGTFCANTFCTRTFRNLTFCTGASPPQPSRTSPRLFTGTLRNLTRNLVLKLHRIAAKLVWTKDPIASGHRRPRLGCVTTMRISSPLSLASCWSFTCEDLHKPNERIYIYIYYIL